MDDHLRLLRLISLIAWAEEHQGGLRFWDESQEHQWRMMPTVQVNELVQGQEPTPHELDAAQDVLSRLCDWYVGAVAHHGDPDRYSTDARELPGFALEAIHQLPDSVLVVLGGMIRQSLGLGDKADEKRLAQLWADDVTATSWRLLVASRQNHHFGR
jgi:hypothetical protein